MQSLQKEKHQFEYAIKRLMHELEEKERQNKVFSEQIFHLETSLNQKKVSFLCHPDPYFDLVFLRLKCKFLFGW